ncbi:hypothetical protein NHP190002_11250 [Helicobacter ailurogastricus]|uniref:hypothetical protein n=1 Tax=Helicobacter ailurogastricus TaxID=1578720 RepID=UPI00244D8291|nr:hypothetical protein [Helicobacter ailurogastricus]GMB90432.1 hypothetical protein NHP190002_11250 [Helicobacter ailurogastricus]
MANKPETDSNKSKEKQKTKAQEKRELLAKVNKLDKAITKIDAEKARLEAKIKKLEIERNDIKEKLEGAIKELAQKQGLDLSKPDDKHKTLNTQDKDTPHNPQANQNPQK